MLKIKLAAIAKDEGAYISEWLHHHFHFGFDEIEVYVNYSSDSMLDILKVLSVNYPIKFSVQDNLANSSGSMFQESAYREIAFKAKEDGFTHILFIDIDEFWTPKNFTTRIHDFVNDLKPANSYLFQWHMHHDESLFSSCFNEKNRLKVAPQLKHLLDLSSPIENVGIHNTYASSFVYRDSQGNLVDFEDDDVICSKLKPNETISDQAFIVHRAYRSQLEYVSLLLRGRPSGQKIKNNRFGYYNKKDYSIDFDISASVLTKYTSSLYSFNKPIADLLTSSKGFVINRFKKCLDVISSDLSEKDRKTLQIALRNISIEDVSEIYERKFGRNKSDYYVNTLRNLALELESDNFIELAFDVMQSAHKLRPHGPVINKKLEHYRKLLQRDDS